MGLPLIFGRNGKRRRNKKAPDWPGAVCLGNAVAVRRCLPPVAFERSANRVCETPAMLYSESETAWLDLRAEKIAEERGWPLPIARSEAAAELVRSRSSGRSVVVDMLRL